MSTRLPKKVAILLEKTKDSALLGVEIYNKPRTAFKSSGYITMMCISYTALFHAIFEKKGVKYFYKKKNSNRYETVDGDYKAWELTKCAEVYFAHATGNPVFKNIDFMAKLRNKIEHRFVPEIDSHVLGECQAFLINYEHILIKEFGPKHSIVEHLNIPLQISNHKRKIPVTQDGQDVIEFIKNHRSAISKTVKDSQEFSFKVFLLPKIGNHRNTSDLAVEFVDFDLADKNQKENFEKIQALIKEKHVPVANQGKFKPTDVLKTIKERTGIEKTPNWHTEMWKKHGVRPATKDQDKTKTKSKFSQYDVVHKDYVYTEDWINLLIKDEIVINKK
jgi:hypothetical protein